jgi:predicted  nucleic acid-binding Zn-ribbon protein
VAKKKRKNSPKTTAQKDKRSKDSMVSKVEIREKRDNTLSKSVGTIFIVLGLLLIGYGVFSFVKNGKNPEVDEALTPPTMSDTLKATNGEEIVVKGEAVDYKRVIVYLDDEEVGKVKVGSDGKYEFNKEIKDEGKYILAVAGEKGFFKKVTTPKSDPLIVSVDRTAPEITKVNYAGEVGTDTFAISGEAEAGCTIILKRGTDVYEVVADEKGKFVIKDIALNDDGVNVYSIVAKDEAGNTKEFSEKVSVIYSQDSSVNGNAVIDTDLPVAAGELDLALSILRDQKVMMVLGIVALIAFVTSSGVVIAKRKRLA